MLYQSLMRGVANVIAAIITIVWFSRGTWKQKKVTEEIKLDRKTRQETRLESGLN